MQWTAHIKERLTRLREIGANNVESLSLLYDLRSKPGVIFYWVKTSARARLGFITAAVAAGIVGSIVFAVIAPLLYVAVILAVTSRLLTDLRSAVGQTARIARANEQEADSLRASDPKRSVMLYQSAAELTCHPEHEKSLHEKICTLEKARPVRPKSDGRSVYQTPGKRAEVLHTVGERYVLADEIGRGGSGAVYRADDLVLDRQVALKELMVTVSDDDTRARFGREAKILAKLNHPNIVQVYDLVEHGGKIWIAMELVDGGDLAALLKRKTRLRFELVAQLGQRMGEALAFAHSQGVIHRDLKPLNVLLSDERTPKITDFGLAKLSEGSVHTVEGLIMGSPTYISPEQAEGKSVSELSDVYSLGIMLYHMLAGHPPFEGDTKSLLMQHIRRLSTPLQDVVADVPSNMSRLVMQMLAKEPAMRPANMAAVARELSACREQTVAST